LSLPFLFCAPKCHPTEKLPSETALLRNSLTNRLHIKINSHNTSSGKKKNDMQVIFLSGVKKNIGFLGNYDNYA